MLASLTTLQKENCHPPKDTQREGQAKRPSAYALSTCLLLAPPALAISSTHYTSESDPALHTQSVHCVQHAGHSEHWLAVLWSSKGPDALLRQMSCSAPCTQRSPSQRDFCIPSQRNEPIMVVFQASAPSGLRRQERCLQAEKPSSKQSWKSCLCCLCLLAALPLEHWHWPPMPCFINTLIPQSCIDFTGPHKACLLTWGASRRPGSTGQ